ncbi:MAG: hypothetical protein SOZ23_00570 [Methanosphaera sp.]|uniref:hypothetical protein n=1 Tax=Methanosphaera sp. TaxID=2666342 RepID=UPI0025CD007A|nr:hypothetical protein [Methanosphaera sp.]MCI5866820.1 hypothetical protein [Methanosphaera sp.]MDD6534327.1 hypothetical protein [Methanosphaera sp.]MDY3955268.1 hypothetical protein [Methanosphaera sp.]
MGAVFLNDMYCLKPFYKWINRNIKSDFYDEDYNPDSFYSVRGKYSLFINLFFGFLPFIVISLILPLIFIPNNFVLQLTLFFAMMFFILFVLCHRDHVFSLPDLDNGITAEEIHFSEDKYPIIFTMLMCVPLAFFCAFFGIGNFFISHNMMFISSSIPKIIGIVMLFYIDVVDKILPINLHKMRNFLIYSVAVIVISFLI